MNLPPTDFWVKAGGGMLVGIVAILLERADAANAIRRANQQGSDELAPWHSRVMVYLVAGVWLAAIFTTAMDFLKWRSTTAAGSAVAVNEKPSGEALSNAPNPQPAMPSPSYPAYYGAPPVNSPAVVDIPNTVTMGQSEETAPNGQNQPFPLSPTTTRAEVVKDERDYADAVDRLNRSAGDRSMAVGNSPRETGSQPPRRTTPLAHPFKPKSACVTINIDPNGSQMKEWYAKTTQAIQSALSRSHAETGNGFIVFSESGNLELARECSKHSEAAVEYRRGKLVSARLDDRSIFIQGDKRHVLSWAARGPELRIGFSTPAGMEAWFVTSASAVAEPKKGDTTYVASLYPDEKRIQLKINCNLAVNSAYEDVGIDELNGGSLTIATPLEIWEKRPIAVDLKNSIAMYSDVLLPDSKSMENGLLVAIDRADRGVKIQQDSLGWYEVILPLKREDIKAKGL